MWCCRELTNAQRRTGAWLGECSLMEREMIDQEAAGSDRRIADALNYADGVERVHGTSSGFAGDGGQSDVSCHRRVAAGLDRAAE